MLRRMWLRVVVLVYFGWTGAVPRVLDAQRPLVVRDSLLPADFSWTLLTLNRERQTLEMFRGSVIVINSWATWCEPCVAELQSMSALRAAMPDSSLVFALVAVQREAPVREFVRRRGLRLPVYLEGSPAPAVYGFDAVPTTWIINARGQIAFRHRGAMRWDTPAVQQFIRGLLNDVTTPR